MKFTFQEIMRDSFVKPHEVCFGPATGHWLIAGF